MGRAFISRSDRGQPTSASAGETGEAEWRKTLWAMVGIQFVMTMAFSVLSPIMPLLLPELGVKSASAVDLWAGILNGVTSFVAALASSHSPGFPVPQLPGGEPSPEHRLGYALGWLSTGQLVGSLVGLPAHRSGAAREPALGVLQGARICGARGVNPTPAGRRSSGRKGHESRR
jgi:hypothetical protein